MSSSLPIDAVLPEILRTLRDVPNLVLEAAPGAGKTTRVPAALLDQLPGHILVLEPRRLAARLAARRVAEERGEKAGDTVGYTVRFEDFTGPRTRLRFLTEGVLTRRLITDPQLSQVSAVVLDEFHERHLDGDLALALLLQLQRTTRPDLKLLIMSATLDAGPIAAHLNNAPVVRSEGRLFPLELRHAPASSAAPEAQIADALGAAMRDTASGDALIFLPGAAEIRRAMDACQGLARQRNLLLLPLFGELPPEEQDRAIARSPQRKAIFSTNIAESSITIDGVTIVIDSGLARVASDSPHTGLPTLTVSRISQASATQRAGRAARTAPGLCVRLYSAEDLHRRAPRDTPEILRRELAPLVLQLRAMDAPELPWLDPPPPKAVTAAQALLAQLNAQGADMRRMADMPVHPRLARLLLEAEKRGAGAAACDIAALLSAGERSPDPDILHALDRDFSYPVRRIAQQLQRQVRKGGTAKDQDLVLKEAILAAYPDRVAKRRKEQEFQIAGGLSAALQKSASLDRAQWIVALDIEERKERGLPSIRLACPIEPELLLDVFPDRIVEQDTVSWNRNAERVESESAMLYEGLTLQSSKDPRPKTEAASKFLAQKVREAGWRKFLDVEETELFLARSAFATQHSALPVIGEAELLQVLEAMCEGRNGFDQIAEGVKGGEVQYQLDRLLGDGGTAMLDSLAPKTLKLPKGRPAPVKYVAGQTPSVASRLQDFWGLKETPRIANGQVAVIVHLLAPNMRPLQMTQDLASFWKKLYPEIRAGLSRRYPKHFWPE